MENWLGITGIYWILFAGCWAYSLARHVLLGIQKYEQNSNAFGVIK